MSMEAEVTARIIEHDIRNQLSNIYLAIEGIKAEFGQDDSEDFACYTDIILNCCKQVENIIKQVK
ncbi:histidine kinase dimerization/phospho-acceptor domain-containing protein [Mucilaginibacter sp.]|uniref:histidine kinase dimerization/phospho-acceptor domain-containing protein n=1 Tax=Mucilaginibacter sp. TaxID=1882438 RepID=UPI003B0036DB